MAGQPSGATEWDVTAAGGAIRLSSRAAGRSLAVNRSNGALVLAGPGPESQFQLEEAGGCPAYPEVEINATGPPAGGSTPCTETSGLLDAHMHLMAYEFVGGRAHCGRPWRRYGAPYAVQDCPDHYPNGGVAILENFYSHGSLARRHDPVGWPTSATGLTRSP